MQTVERSNPTGRKKWLFLLIPLFMVFLASTVVSVREFLNDADINISVTEDEDELEIMAKFPRDQTRVVHDYLRSQLNLSDLSDLNAVVIKKYQTPDDLMTISLKSKPGYLKIVFDKHRNSREAYRKLKNASEGIKSVLTSHPISRLLLENKRVYPWLTLHDILLVQ
jgi:hypothetical protein